MASKASPEKVKTCGELGSFVPKLKEIRQRLAKERAEGKKNRDWTQAKAVMQEAQEIANRYFDAFHPIKGSAENQIDDIFWHKDFFEDALLAPSQPLLRKKKLSEISSPKYIFETQVRGSKKKFMDFAIGKYLSEHPEQIPEAWFKLAEAKPGGGGIAIILWGDVQTLPASVSMLGIMADRTLDLGIDITDEVFDEEEMEGIGVYSAVMPR